MLTTTDVGNDTGSGVPDIKCYPSVVHSMLEHFASFFRDSPPVQPALEFSPTKALLRGLDSAVQ